MVIRTHRIMFQSSPQRGVLVKKKEIPYCALIGSMLLLYKGKISHKRHPASRDYRFQFLLIIDIIYSSFYMVYLLELPDYLQEIYSY